MPDKMIKAIRNLIASYILEHKSPPSVREIADGMGLKSTSSAQHYLDIMIEAGILETDTKPRQPRALRIPETSVTILEKVSYIASAYNEYCQKNHKSLGDPEYQMQFMLDSYISEGWIP